eukprot:GHVP01065294.1.p1 GENE.GHVP01065294.1~~GHVP01065294.1.p1  ORF type:complete len:534 (+),score=79.20 GHVP01065294.1:145-1746(+)
MEKTLGAKVEFLRSSSCCVEISGENSVGPELQEKFKKIYGLRNFEVKFRTTQEILENLSDQVPPPARFLRENDLSKTPLIDVKWLRGGPRTAFCIFCFDWMTNTRLSRESKCVQYSRTVLLKFTEIKKRFIERKVHPPDACVFLILPTDTNLTRDDISKFLTPYQFRVVGTYGLQDLASRVGATEEIAVQGIRDFYSALSLELLAQKHETLSTFDNAELAEKIRWTFKRGVIAEFENDAKGAMDAYVECWELLGTLGINNRYFANLDLIMDSAYVSMRMWRIYLQSQDIYKAMAQFTLMCSLVRERVESKTQVLEYRCLLAWAFSRIFSGTVKNFVPSPFGSKRKNRFTALSLSYLLFAVRCLVTARQKSQGSVKALEVLKGERYHDIIAELLDECSTLLEPISYGHHDQAAPELVRLKSVMEIIYLKEFRSVVSQSQTPEQLALEEKGAYSLAKSIFIFDSWPLVQRNAYKIFLNRHMSSIQSLSSRSLPSKLNCDSQCKEKGSLCSDFGKSLEKILPKEEPTNGKSAIFAQ